MTRLARSLGIGALALFATACTWRSYVIDNDVALDASDTTGESSVIDVPDARDAGDVMPPLDGMDVLDAIDAPSDVPPDAADAVDHTDVADVRDARDANDVADVVETGDTSDAADAADATDATDATDASCTLDTTTDPLNCGACGNDCTRKTNVVNGSDVSCVGGQCVYGPTACLQGWGHCGSDPNSGCETPLESTANCGACGAACATPTPFCAPNSSGASCVANCGASATLICSGVCVDATSDLNNCGSCNSMCPGDPNGVGTPVCTSGSCGLTCTATTHVCNRACVDNMSIANCGTSCTPCMPPANSSATCDGTSCGFACNVGFVLLAGACVPPPPPQLIAPMSTSWVTVTHPTLRWQLAAGDGVHIEICADRACGTIEQTFDVVGTSGQPPMALTPGPHFWHAEGTSSGVAGTVFSPTWEFFAPASDAPIDTAVGSVLDLNGDGLADLAVGAPADQPSPAIARIDIYPGTPGAPGVATMPVRQINATSTGTGLGHELSSAGDVNGDGFGDLVASEDHGNVRIFLGAPSFAISTTGVICNGSDISFQSVSGAGDMNRDGYGDIIVGGGNLPTRVLFGGPSQCGAMTLGSGNGGGLPAAVSDAGDFNGDGFADVVVQVSSTQFNVVLGAASGPFARTMLSFSSPGAANHEFAFAHDLNGDGLSDIVTSGGDGFAVGDVEIFFGTTATSTAPAFVDSGISGAISGEAPFVAAAGDINGDGRLDVVFTTGSDAIPLLNNGGGSFTVGSSFVTNSAWEVSGGVDLGNDGVRDLAVGQADLMDVALFSIPGSGSPAPTTMLSDGIERYGRAVAMSAR